MNSYSTDQVAEMLGLSADGVRNYKKRNQALFTEGTHFYKSAGAIYYTESGLELINQLRGNEPTSASAPIAESQSGAELLETLASHFRPLLAPLAQVISGKLKQEFEDEVLNALFESLEPLNQQQSRSILNRYGLLPGVELTQIAGSINYLEGSSDVA